VIPLVLLTKTKVIMKVIQLILSSLCSKDLTFFIPNWAKGPNAEVPKGRSAFFNLKVIAVDEMGILRSAIWHFLFGAGCDFCLCLCCTR
jgi:hypothetical protein